MFLEVFYNALANAVQDFWCDVGFIRSAWVIVGHEEKQKLLMCGFCLHSAENMAGTYDRSTRLMPEGMTKTNSEKSVCIHMISVFVKMDDETSHKVPV